MSGQNEFNKAYYAVIPANVRYDVDLPPNAKLLYGEITALSNEKGYCWASNDYFAQLYGVNKKTVSNWVGLLEAKGYIYRHMEYKTGSKEIKERRIFIHYPIHKIMEGGEQKNGGGMDKKMDTPIHEKMEDNNTSSNNTINILDEDDDKKALAEIENEFKKYYSKKITPIIRKTLKELLDVANKDLLLYSIGKLQDVDKPIAYLKAIIKNYLQNDVQTVEQAKVFDDKYKSKRKTKVKTDNTVPSGGVTVPNHFYYDWMNDLEDEEGIKKDYQSQNQNL